mmetsp:Transcript_19805/g.78895  ORF Transcript_19805/g.78895 Transcript_19805/m.78895 type:complete len:205 (-) Transcript_19805:3074-3688(-)
MIVQTARAQRGGETRDVARCEGEAAACEREARAPDGPGGLDRERRRVESRDRRGCVRWVALSSSAVHDDAAAEAANAQPRRLGGVALRDDVETRDVGGQVLRQLEPRADQTRAERRERLEEPRRGVVVVGDRRESAHRCAQARHRDRRARGREHVDASAIIGDARLQPRPVVVVVLAGVRLEEDLGAVVVGHKAEARRARRELR